jgi:hypothetical protein
MIFQKQIKYVDCNILTIYVFNFFFEFHGLNLLKFFKWRKSEFSKKKSEQ